MAEKKIPAILMIDEHLIVGEVETSGRRLLEVFNDTLTDWLQVFDAHVARRTAKGQAIATLNELMVRKADVRIAVPGGATHESPEKRRFAYVEKKQFPTVAIVDGYEIRGVMHLKAKREMHQLLVDLASFVPLTEATISHAGPSEEKLDAEVAIINKTFLRALHVGDAQGSPLVAPALAAAE